MSHVIDHAIHYAWIAAAPKERLPRFLRKSYSHAINQHETMAERDIALLDPGLLARYRAYLEAHPLGTGKLPRWQRRSTRPGWSKYVLSLQSHCSCRR